MSDGYNSRFLTEKSAFLQASPITVGFFQSKMPADAGVFDFDIDPIKMTNRMIPNVQAFEHREKAATWRSKRISAFWLPWKSQQSVHLDIDDNADYFFTSELNGCHFRIVRTGMTSLRAVHVAGDLPNSGTKMGSDKRNALANSSFSNPGQAAFSRGLSSSVLLGNTGLNNRIGYGGDHVAWTNVVGFRYPHGLLPATWEIWYQAVGPDRNGQLCVLDCQKII